MKIPEIAFKNVAIVFLLICVLASSLTIATKYSNTTSETHTANTSNNLASSNLNSSLTNSNAQAPNSQTLSSQSQTVTTTNNTTCTEQVIQQVEKPYNPDDSPLASFSGITRVSDALRAEDDLPCMLEGHIIARISQIKNRYMFEDATGRIIVHIKAKVFGPLIITPETKIRIVGEVESDSKRHNEIDVEGLCIIP